MAQAVLAYNQFVACKHGGHQGVVEINFPLLDAHDVIGDVVSVKVGNGYRACGGRINARSKTR